MTDLYITTSIPYVNGAPHLGHALELVHVDALARHRAATGAVVRVQSGTDDHALKNVAAAAEAGVGVAEFVASHGDRFADLAHALGVRTDAFVRTSRDPCHPQGVRRLWTACAAAGDLYRKDYTGRYCTGCEQFYAPEELVDGACGEHPADAVSEVSETNWFFRLSAYRDRISDLIRSGRIEVSPAERRHEVLGFLAGEVLDLSVSRPAARAAGWGIGVPEDPDQVIYVWFDALANYLTGLGYGTADEGHYRRWWSAATERVHVIGKGIIRFHAVYWIAFLLSAGLPLPTRILVHDYLTVNGSKISKSGAVAADPATLIAEYGQDAVRWCLLREPARLGTTDVTTERLVGAYNRDLANTVGNLASRTLTLARARTASRNAPEPGPGQDLLTRGRTLRATVTAALTRYDVRSACEAIIEVAASANRFLEAEAPWHLARAAHAGDRAAAARFDAVINAVLSTCDLVAEELEPFVPDGARRLRTQLTSGEPKPSPAFPRLQR